MQGRKQVPNQKLDDDKSPFVRTNFLLLFHFKNDLNSLNCALMRFSTNSSFSPSLGFL